ncbi:hypothetical protein AGABI1DRAFT_123945 [Agaricus bisporus var. burnettii JB137-S8]|uniref:Las1-domain-containing protein n=1 Tax=Agaricus bisporus var. burnettii (strain JB137-S8 / ATCC MYA-4627 / FGSC 10392) TaxID=597362 RepID=K5XJU9_AGABU|nr:uncharacterized protein AGABI1DRAFT_123945 [Agaricus bisporus var. burnettii JB137-S8]EKM83617.1 hypothetical protein AGABI1DRAFT_123945 [Agaricus bisporus var. burnettii JB137-S8]
MRLPRRVPWASSVELEHVCSWIFTDQHDLEAKDLAVNRLSAWKAVTSLPHALECTLALLVAIQQDRKQENAASGSPLNYLSLRHGYASAIIRLVNGLVDPLQLGAYARSIASIATQLGLPPWLVELRHAATHEDLPSLETLREAARQSMAWLLHNYFLPTINPVSASQKRAPSLRPLSPTLKRYKLMTKAIIRDASLRTRFKHEIVATTRDVERWIAEAKVAANIGIGDVGWGMGDETSRVPRIVDGGDNINFKEMWALERLCDVLLEKGGLVPLSRKKRTDPGDKFWPPTNSISLWSPLLKHLQMLHIDFARTICARILSILLPEPVTAIPSSGHLNDEGLTPTEVQYDPSYYMCLARWVMWSIDTWSDVESETDIHLRRDVTESLMQALGHCLNEARPRENVAAEALLQAICSQESRYAIAMNFVTKRQQLAPKDWTDQDMTTMNDRLAQVQSMSGKQIKPVPSSEPLTTNSDAIEAMEIDIPPTGWRKVNLTGWRPCPIGVFHKSSLAPVPVTS